MKRRLMGRELIEVFEEITSTRNWIAPPGCKSVDAFIVAGGKDGSPGTPSASGPGGNGGECVIVNAIPVSSTRAITVVVGAANGNSSFGTYTATTGAGKTGGYGISQDQQSGNGNPGQDGVYAFGNTAYSANKYGASGASGGAAAINGVQGTTYKGGTGGNKGGGNGGDSPYISSSFNGTAGKNASWYGSGGGGGGKGGGSGGGIAPGGLGYQGIIILHYWKYQ